MPGFFYRFLTRLPTIGDTRPAHLTITIIPCRSQTDIGTGCQSILSADGHGVGVTVVGDTETGAKGLLVGIGDIGHRRDGGDPTVALVMLLRHLLLAMGCLPTEQLAEMVDTGIGRANIIVFDGHHRAMAIAHLCDINRIAGLCPRAQIGELTVITRCAEGAGRAAVGTATTAQRRIVIAWAATAVVP